MTLYNRATLPQAEKAYNSLDTLVERIIIMLKKLFLGLAIVGGGVYLYDQNVLPILPRDEKAKQIAIKNGKPSPEVRKEFNKLDAKARDFGSQLKKTAAESTEDIRNKADSAITSVKESEIYNKWSQKLDSYASDVERAATEVENLPLGKRLAAKYIDGINKLGQTDEEKLKELASLTSLRQQEIKADLSKKNQLWGSWWLGKKSEADAKADELKYRAEKEKNSWFSWGESKKDEAKSKADQLKKDAEKEKSSWVSWGESKKDEAKAKTNQLKKDAEKEKSSWLSWGESKKDEARLNADRAKYEFDQQKKEWSESWEAGKQRALEEYNLAKKSLDDFTKSAGDAVYNKDQQAHLEKAKGNLLSALTNLKKYGNDLIDQVSK